MHLGISQNKTVNSLFGHLQGIRTLKVSEGLIFHPSRSGLFLHEPLLCKFFDGKDTNSVCTALCFHVWCTDGLEPPVTEG